MSALIDGLREMAAYHERIEDMTHGELSAKSAWFSNVALQAADALERLEGERDAARDQRDRAAKSADFWINQYDALNSQIDGLRAEMKRWRDTYGIPEPVPAPQD